MDIQDDETLQVYIEESLEHLSDIENDFLAIEEAGSDIDEDLVNKVYRAAHSIKGGAGFMGLTNIKDLTHEMENILGKIRSRDMVPNPEIINILLLASDTLRDMLNDVFNSNDMDILQHIESLKAIVEGSVSQEVIAPEATASIEIENDQPVFDTPSVSQVFQEDIINAGNEGKCVYHVEIDLIQDVHMKDKLLSGFFEELQQSGTIIDVNVDMDAIGALEEINLPDQLQVKLLFATILKPDDINLLFDTDEKNIFEVNEDLSMRSIGEEQIEPVESEALTPEQDAGKEAPKSEIQEPELQEQKAEEFILEEFVKKVGQKEPATVHSEISAPGGPNNKDKKMDKKSDREQASAAVETSLRVHVSLLDSLMTLAGELVLSRNQLLQAISSGDNRTSELAGQRIDLITSELQGAIMLTRMQPIGNVFNKFPRVVRDLSKNLGKQVILTIEGKEVELDKTIIEAINDPLTHLVRNAVDHGIESLDDRQKSRKDSTGKIFLKAFHEAGQVNIEISDDGKGLDGARLAAAAAEKGLVTEDQAMAMSEKEKVNLILLPGFSTAEKVTDVSGRGVGMDVVKTNLDKLGGVVDINSVPGEGTTIQIKLPLTLAIIPSQIILAGGERYAIPQVNMEELLRIPADQVKNRIEIVGDAKVVRLRGKLLPLIKLADVLGIEQSFFDPEEEKEKKDRRQNIADRRSRQSRIETGKVKSENGNSKFEIVNPHPETRNLQPATRNPEPATCNPEPATRNSNDRRYHTASALNIVVVSTGTVKYGLVVDKLNDSEEIVVKPLGRHLKHCKGYAGATIMGDGRIALILDVGNLAQMADLNSVEESDRAAEVAMETDAAIRAKKDKQSLLTFRGAEDEQFAVSLSQVERIEKIMKTDIEDVGGKKVIKYRGGSLALFSIDQVARVKPMSDTDNLLVIVFNIADREVGIMAVGPVDAKEISVEVDGSTLKQPGIMGSAIIEDYTTLLVDVFGLIQILNPEWFTQREVVQTSEGEASTILYAEDSKFFRNQVKGCMEEEGYKVIEAEDGMIAWNLLQEYADEISLVVTDIEMPNLDGLGLAEKIRSEKRFDKLPIVAVTTLAGDEDIARGKAAGINDYQVKLDREKLMVSVHGFLEGS